jgi:hypothetical protein
VRNKPSILPPISKQKIIKTFNKVLPNRNFIELSEFKEKPIFHRPLVNQVSPMVRESKIDYSPPPTIKLIDR